MSDSYDESGGPDSRERFRQEYESQRSEEERRRRSRSTWLIATIVGLLLLLMMAGGSACRTYNSLQAKREKVKVEWSNVDIQLQRRADLIPNLVNTVRGYTKHEEQVFGEIATARSRLLNAQSAGEKAEANEQVSAALGRLLMLTENYPDLKASEQFKTLQYELAGTENRISIARRDYNQAVVDYNISRQRFPTVLIANPLGFQREEEFKAPEAAREVPKVNF